MLTTDEAFEKIKSHGITHNKNVFLKMVREGKIHGRMISKKRGYRFEEKDIDYFIEEYGQNEEFNMSNEMERLTIENEELKKKLKMPKEYWIKENNDLRMMLENKEVEIEELKEKLEEMKEDKTIRIRVE